MRKKIYYTERSKNILFIIILLTGCLNFLYAQPVDLQINTGIHDNNKSELKGDAMIIRSKTYKQKSKHFNEKDFPEIDYYPVRRIESNQIFDKKGNFIYEKHKDYALRRDIRNFKTGQNFAIYEGNFNIPTSSVSTMNNYDKNNNLVQSIKRSVYRPYLDYRNNVNMEKTDSVKVSHTKAEFAYNDENKKIQAKIYENDQLKYESTYEYDDEGMNIGQVYIRYDSLGNIEVKKSYSHKYDKHGNLSELECYNKEGKLIRKITPEFDENGNLKKTKEVFINEDGSSNRFTIYEYDIKGNNRLKKECYSEPCKEPARLIKYKYDESGKLIEETHYRGPEIVFKENHKEEKDEDLENLIYKYDSLGNWVEKFCVKKINKHPRVFYYSKIKRTIIY